MPTTISIKFFDEVGSTIFRDEWTSLRETIYNMVRDYVEKLLTSKATFSSIRPYSVGFVDAENPSRRVHIFLRNENLFENALAIVLDNASVAIGYVSR